jgi:hypothetical protein
LNVEKLNFSIDAKLELFMKRITGNIEQAATNRALSRSVPVVSATPSETPEIVDKLQKELLQVAHDMENHNENEQREIEFSIKKLQNIARWATRFNRRMDEIRDALQSLQSLDEGQSGRQYELESP